MIGTIGTYIRQRYSLRLFPALAAYLLLYADGVRWSPAEAIVAFIYMLVLLFWFRLFDDLASRDVDMGKPDRIYTDDEAHRVLRIALVPLGIIVVAMWGAYDLVAGMVLLVSIVVTMLAYRALFDRANWRTLLPLCKYPLVVFLLSMTFGATERVVLEDLLVAFSVLPAFILFESFDDESFRIGRGTRIALVVAGHLLLLPAIDVAWYPVVVGGTIVMSIVVALADRFSMPGAQYGVLLWFLVIGALRERFW